MRTRVKICCIANLAEAQMAIEAGADALGLVGPMPSGPGVITLDQASAIAQAAPPPVATFFLTSAQSAEDILEQAAQVRPTAVQIVRHIDPIESEKLAKLAPSLRRVQVIHVEDKRALDLIEVYAPFVHGFLLDSGRPSAPTAELGGTGRVHDWRLSRRIVKKSTLPVFLAGGLKPQNANRAIQEVGAFGLDLCSGVRSEGKLDSDKLRAFMKAVRDAAV